MEAARAGEVRSLAGRSAEAAKEIKQLLTTDSVSREQSQGVAQAGEAITLMDQTTQQNAALVEQMAEVASNLQAQAHDSVQTVAVFKLQPTQQPLLLR